MRDPKHDCRIQMGWVGMMLMPKMGELACICSEKPPSVGPHVSNAVLLTQKRLQALLNHGRDGRFNGQLRLLQHSQRMNTLNGKARFLKSFLMHVLVMPMWTSRHGKLSIAVKTYLAVSWFPYLSLLACLLRGKAKPPETPK